MRREGSWKGL
jgi:tetratricopeptide (TPR) repeat protein